MIVVACVITLNGLIGRHSEQFESLHPHPEDHTADLLQLRQLRTRMTGVVVGHNTFKAYPKVHAVDRAEPLHHVVVSQQPVPPPSTLAKPLFLQAQHPVWWAAPKAIATPNTAYTPIPFNGMAHLCQQLKAIGEHWLIEGGGQLVQAMLQANCADEVYLTLSPNWLATGVPLLPHGGMGQRAWHLQKTHCLTGSVVLHYQLQPLGYSP
jgi:riboflavin biosynthesis pyrimidine reductase